ncbi:GDSL-type esterase/lipase family protein [Butyrivibrio sp. XPD2006]|uniref:GDSL-type esterase/lipase family protein n=1 Tax=Butyrivibrio sp. XPD2006 TaxID=1280668 RepID=UPI0003B6D68C|nr:GDSL-type esterase/lipase family protein [Butyrivibrio sp. XPD2006]
MNTYMVEKYRHLNKNIRKGQILFVGSSLMEHFPINEILVNRGLDLAIYNRGISGYTIPELLESMDEQIFDLEPSVIFINIGTNDISRPEETEEDLQRDYKEVLRQIKEKLFSTKVYMMAYYPVNPAMAQEIQAWPEAAEAAKLRKERLPRANDVVKKLAAEFGYEFIDVNEGLCDEKGELRRELSTDGIHMWPEAYEIIFDNMKDYLLKTVEK